MRQKGPVIMMLIVAVPLPELLEAVTLLLDSALGVCRGAAGCGAVPHSFVSISSVSPREAQNSCVGCIVLMKPLGPDAPGRAQAVNVNPIRGIKSLTSAPSKNTRNDFCGPSHTSHAHGSFANLICRVRLSQESDFQF